MKINVLGTKYKVRFGTMEDGYDGETNFFTKEILISKAEKHPEEYRNVIKKSAIRHEIIHAFLYESGLDTCALKSAHWARNEEMVDFFALQFPKIIKAMKKAGAL